MFTRKTYQHSFPRNAWNAALDWWIDKEKFRYPVIPLHVNGQTKSEQRSVVYFVSNLFKHSIESVRKQYDNG